MGYEERVDEREVEIVGVCSTRRRDRYCFLRCEECGYLGHRRFVLRADGEWREILGGERGITPEMWVCDCGSRRWERVEPA